jgi:hypothetical protein
VKNSKAGYHLYQNGEHNHPALKPVEEADEEEEEEEGEEDEVEMEEDQKEELIEEMAVENENKDQQKHPQQGQQPPKSIVKRVRGQKREYYYLKTVKSVKELEAYRFKVPQNAKLVKLVRNLSNFPLE